MSRFSRPESDRLPLSNGDWIIVKRRLNTGEQRAYLKRCSTLNDEGVRRIDPIDHGMSRVVAYLIEWSLVDSSQQPVSLQGLDPDGLMAILDNLDPDAF